MKTIADSINTNKVSLIAFGDALLSDKIYREGASPEYYYSFISDLQDEINKYDLRYYNQESIINPSFQFKGSLWVNKGLNQEPTFSSPKEFADGILKAGFNLVSLANNHVYDNNIAGVYDSLDYWKNKPVITSGSQDSNQPSYRIFEKNGIKFGFVAYTDKKNDYANSTILPFLRNDFSFEKSYKDIIEMKQLADVIIVSIHWGHEYKHYYIQKQKQIAEFFSEMGVNIVLGMHSHSTQPIETIGNTLIYYSLGNFIAAQKIDSDVTRTGQAATIIISKDNNKINIYGSSKKFYMNWKENYNNYKLNWI